MGVAQTAPIIMSDEATFTIADIYGNTLRFDRFAYEWSLFAARGSYHDANWVCCRITLKAKVEEVEGYATIKQSVDAQLLTTEIKELSDTLAEILSTPGTEKTFQPMEPYIVLRIARSDEYVNVGARLDLAPAVGPVIDFTFTCRPDQIEAAREAVVRVQDAFPERHA